MFGNRRAVLCALFVAAVFSTCGYAATPDRISGAIDSNNLVELKGHVTPMARPEADQGPVEPSRMMRVTMLFMPSAQQQRALDKLLLEQQDTKSASFHKWLTSDEYGERFGLSRSDLEKISSWLEGRGLKVTYVAHGRNFLSVEGNAAQIDSVFKTEIHYFNAGGRMHFANTSAPMIPAALDGIVGGFRGLHDFFPHSMLRKPEYTITVSGASFHFLAPGDIATIYDINPLYQASPAIVGTGQSVVVAGQSDVYLADLHYFRTAFGLSDITGCKMDSTNTIIQAGSCSSGNFQMVVPGTGADPHLVPGDLGESDLDIEWIGSLAPGAKIIFVTSSNGVDDSASWAIDQSPPLAPVISYSYGLCEAFVLAPNIASAEVEYKKAASEGISFFAASGDAGSAACDGDNGANPPAVLGLSVSYPASSPEVTGVGGTEFNEGTGNYWNPANGANGGSAERYIPKIAWNDTTLSVNNGGSFDATGGGASNCATGSTTTTVPPHNFAFQICTGGFPKPAWQNGVTPNDNARDVPDISFSASNANDVYIVCVPQSELVNNGVSTSTCANGINSALTSFKNPSAFGGTSASTPVAAGMTVLLNQLLGGSQGSMNPLLYAAYKNDVAAFHDILAGSNPSTLGTSDNIVSCTAGTPSFEPASQRCTAATMGYSAVAGYDPVTGLGSVDIDKLATDMAAGQSFTLTPNPSSYQVAQGQSVDATVSVSFASGFSGTVSFTCPSPGSEMTCTAPSPINAPGTVSFHITTRKPTAALLWPAGRGSQNFYAALVPGLLGIVLTMGSRKQLSMRFVGLIMLLGISTLWLGSCGGNNSSSRDPGTPTGTYTITVTGTSGTASNSQSFQLVVAP